MTNRSLLRTAAVGGLLGLTLGASQSAWAVATITLSTNDSVVYPQGSGTHSITVDFKVQLAPGDGVDQVLTYFAPIVAYDPSILKYNSMTFGDALTSGPPTSIAAVTYDPLSFPVNYLDPFSESPLPPSMVLDPSIQSTYSLGTPDNGTLVGSGYVDGSLWPQMNVGVGFDATAAANLLVKQLGAGGALLYSITFDVITDNLASSSIILIDDRSYLGFPANGELFDYKRFGTGGEVVFYPTSNSMNVRVPVPAPLALMAAGLAWMGARRRRR